MKWPKCYWCYFALAYRGVGLKCNTLRLLLPRLHVEAWMMGWKWWIEWWDEMPKNQNSQQDLKLKTCSKSFRLLFSPPFYYLTSVEHPLHHLKQIWKCFCFKDTLLLNYPRAKALSMGGETLHTVPTQKRLKNHRSPFCQLNQIKSANNLLSTC